MDPGMAEEVALKKDAWSWADAYMEEASMGSGGVVSYSCVG
jgi:hypothetical protein